MHNIPRGESQDHLFLFSPLVSTFLFFFLLCHPVMVFNQQNMKTQEAKETDVRSQGKEDWAAQEKHLQVTLSVK